MNKRFVRFGLIAIVLTYASVFVSVNYDYLTVKKVDLINKVVKVNAGVSVVKSYDKTKSLVEEGTFFTPCLNSSGNKLLYSSGDNIYEMDMVTKAIKQLTYMGNCYNPMYYEKDNNIITFARNNGIYIMDLAKNTTNKIVTSDKQQVSFARPNFTMEGDIIYFKVTVLPKPEGHGFIEENPAIYRISKDGKNNEKILDGYEPILSKNGKKLCYELKNNIYVIDLETRKNKLIDSGKYASWSMDGNYISYTKFDKNTIPYKKVKSTKKLYIDKEFSNIFIASINNPKEKYRITNEEFENKDQEIESWAFDLKHTNCDQHFLVVSQNVFFDSLWSKDGKFMFVSLYNSSKGNFELVKYNINIK